MTQKEKSLIVLKTIILTSKEADIKNVSPDYLIGKIDACFSLQNPGILLNEKEEKTFNHIVEDLRKKGKII